MPEEHRLEDGGALDRSPGATSAISQIIDVATTAERSPALVDLVDASSSSGALGGIAATAERIALAGRRASALADLVRESVDVSSSLSSLLSSRDTSVLDGIMGSRGTSALDGIAATAKSSLTEWNRRNEAAFGSLGLVDMVDASSSLSSLLSSRDTSVLETASNGRGITRTSTYNLNDQVTQVTFTGTGSGAQSTTYGYDTAGRLASRTDSTSGATTATTTWSYDQLGRLLTRQTTVAAGSGGGGGGVITYTYDKASNLASSTSTVGGTVTYTYDSSGLPTSLTYPDPAAGTPGLMRFTYDDQGRRTATYLKTNATLSIWASRTRNTYDNSGRVTRVQADTGPSTANIVDLSYCYTTGTTPAAPGSGACTGPATADRDKVQWRRDNLTGKATTYTYDTAGRLTQAQVSGGATFAYTFDANGNRLTASNGSTSQSLNFNKANQISTTGYTYDATGNQKNDPSTSTSAITYTGADQLKSVTKAGTAYTYLHAGVDNVELLRQTSPSGTHATTYGRTAPTGVPVVEQTSVNDGTTTKNTAVISDPVTGTPLMLRTDNGVQSMYVYDGTPGAPIALVSSASIQQFGYDYDPYGVPTITQNSGSQAVPQNPYTFAGTGVKDRTTGWVHYANRYYNPATGTWTQQDDLDAPLDPANANRYAFAGGDPISNTDPTGRDILEDIEDAATTIGTFAGAGAGIGATVGCVVATAGCPGGAGVGAGIGSAIGTVVGVSVAIENYRKKN